MRSILSALALATVALAGTACSRSNTRTQTPVTIPESYSRTTGGSQAGFAPVARGTIRLGEVETAGATTEAPPNAVGGGPAASAPGASQTSVGAMSPTTVTGADSPLDSATTAPPAAGQPANPTMTGSAGAPGGPNSHGGVAGHPAGR